jgi:hypothetical protein
MIINFKTAKMLSTTLKRSADGTGKFVQQPEQKHEQQRHLHSCDIPARYCCAWLGIDISSNSHASVFLIAAFRRLFF